jgi:hypothetical protein
MQFVRILTTTASVLVFLVGCLDPSAVRTVQVTGDAAASAGSVGAICYPNGTCNSGLNCVGGLCSAPAVGTEAGPCYANGTCNAGLVCEAGRCATETSDTGTSDTGAEDTDVADTGTEETGIDDTGAEDTGADTGIADTGRDTGGGGGTTDTGSSDTGATDTGESDTSIDPDTTVDPDTTADTGVDTTADTTADTTPDTSGDTADAYVCGSAPAFSGQIFGSDAPSGGVPLFVNSRSEFTYGDANLDEVISQFPTVDGDPIILPTPVVITGAVVVATSYMNTAAVPPSQSNFWVADSNGTVEVRLDFTNAANVPVTQIRVGHKLNFIATAVDSYFGSGQIQAAASWELVEADTGVHVLERTTTALTTDDIGEIVRVEGTLTGGGGACGGSSRCYDLTYANGQVVLYRSASTLLTIGQCVTFVGPLSQFSGEPQINVANFDWATTAD